jgi:hypothetical protein
VNSHDFFRLLAERKFARHNFKFRFVESLPISCFRRFRALHWLNEILWKSKRKTFPSLELGKFIWIFFRFGLRGGGGEGSSPVLFILLILPREERNLFELNKRSEGGRRALTQKHFFTPHKFEASHFAEVFSWLLSNKNVSARCSSFRLYFLFH